MHMTNSEKSTSLAQQLQYNGGVSKNPFALAVEYLMTYLGTQNIHTGIIEKLQATNEGVKWVMDTPGNIWTVWYPKISVANDEKMTPEFKEAA